MAKDVLRPVDDAARALAARLLRSTSSGSLASLEPGSGWPYASLVTAATALDGAPAILVSELSLHAKALAADARCSLLSATAGPGDPLAHPRLTIFGRAKFLSRSEPEQAQVRRRFLSRHPKAALYADFGDFSFVRIEPERALLNAGFGRAHELAAADFLTPLDPALLPLLDTEADAIEHMNNDHPEAVRLIATRLCGGPEGAWRLTGVDPEGLDLALDGSFLRYVHPEPLRDAGQLRDRLVAATREARAAPDRRPL